MNTTTVSLTANNSFALPFDETGLIVTAAALFPLCVVGIFGNVVTIMTILISTKLTSTWYLLIISLSISDLMSAIISPIFVYRRTWGFEIWNWPNFFCKVWWSVDSWTSFATTLHILWFTILRFFSIQWPHQFKSIISQYTKASIVMIWIVAFGAGFMPFSVWAGAFKRDRSDSHPSSKWPSCAVHKDNMKEVKLYRHSTLIIFYCIPCILIIIGSIAIGVKVNMLRKKRRDQGGNRLDRPAAKRRTRKEKQMVVQLILIVSSFMMGYLPKVAFSFYTFSSPSSPNQAKINWWFGIVDYMLLRISECLNPVIYNLASSKMRLETIKTLKRIYPHCRKQIHVNNISSSVFGTGSSRI